MVYTEKQVIEKLKVAEVALNEAMLYAPYLTVDEEIGFHTTISTLYALIDRFRVREEEDKHLQFAHRTGGVHAG